MQPTESVKNPLETEILSYLRYEFPEYYHKSITEPKKEFIDYVSSMFDEFDGIQAEPEKKQFTLGFSPCSRSIF